MCNKGIICFLFLYFVFDFDMDHLVSSIIAIVVTCSLVRDTDLEWMVDRVAAFGRFAPIMFM